MKEHLGARRGIPPHLHYPSVEADPGVVSSIAIDHGCPEFQLCVRGPLVLQVLV